MEKAAKAERCACLPRMERPCRYISIATIYFRCVCLPGGFGGARLGSAVCPRGVYFLKCHQYTVGLVVSQPIASIHKVYDSIEFEREILLCVRFFSLPIDIQYITSRAQRPVSSDYQCPQGR